MECVAPGATAARPATGGSPSRIAGASARDSPTAATEAIRCVPGPNAAVCDCEAVHVGSVGRSPSIAESPLVSSVLEGLRAGVRPQLASGCTGGTYLICKGESCAAVFKPSDEEPFSPYNPHGFVGELASPSRMRAGVAVGEAALREVAAYRLDHGRLAGVPETTLVSVRHPWNGGRVQRGSLQQYRAHMCDAEDMGASMFGVADLHAIAVLDIRICNLDRHDGNMLVVKGDAGAPHGLVPIDHGFAIPRFTELSDVRLGWMDWPQSSEPTSEMLVTYVAALDGAADADMLVEDLGIPPQCAVTVHLTTLLLQAGISSGMTLGQVAALMVREDQEEASELEALRDAAVADAEQLVGHARGPSAWPAFRAALAAAFARNASALCARASSPVGSPNAMLI